MILKIRTLVNIDPGIDFGNTIDVRLQHLSCTKLTPHLWICDKSGVFQKCYCIVKGDFIVQFIARVYRHVCLS